MTTSSYPLDVAAEEDRSVLPTENGTSPGPVAFDVTPQSAGIFAGTLVIAHVLAGDIIERFVFSTPDTIWNGTTPGMFIGVSGATLTDQVYLGNLSDLTFGPNHDAIDNGIVMTPVGTSDGPWVMAVEADVLALVTDGAGGNPGSTAGLTTVTTYISRPAYA